MRACCIAQATQLNALCDLNGKEILKRDICIHITDTIHHAAETNTNCKAAILQFNKKYICIYFIYIYTYI